MKHVVPFVLVLGLAAAAGAQEPAKAPAAGHALVVLGAAPGGKVSGTIHFEEAKGGVRVHGRIEGLEPGKHGFHVHEFGDCSAADFTSAGPHFNPTGHPHAAPGDAQRHVGDMGNVEAGADGVAKVDYTDAQLAFSGAKSILGRGVIVHAKADDLKTQPTGDAGGRLACGVVGVAKAAEAAPAAHH